MYKPLPNRFSRCENGALESPAGSRMPDKKRAGVDGRRGGGVAGIRAERTLGAGFGHGPFCSAEPARPDRNRVHSGMDAPRPRSG